MGELGLSSSGVELAWKKSEVRLPAVCMRLDESLCVGVSVAGGLYLQCSRKKVGAGSLFCNVCSNSCLRENRPRNGIYSERISVEDWRTEEGKGPKSWLTYLKEMGLCRKDGEDILRKHGIKKINDKEWEEKKQGRRGRRSSCVSDTSSEGEKPTMRFLPIEGKKKSPPKENSHKGKNGKTLRVAKYKTSNIVAKVFVSNWTESAHEKFAEMYCKGEKDKNEGEDFGKRSKKKNKAESQLQEMQAKYAEKEAEKDAEIEALKRRLAEQSEEKREESQEEAEVNSPLQILSNPSVYEIYSYRISALVRVRPACRRLARVPWPDPAGTCLCQESSRRMGQVRECGLARQGRRRRLVVPHPGGR